MGELSEITVPLATPVEVGGSKIASLTLRRPRTGELRKLHKAGAFTKLMALASRAEAAKTQADGLELLSVYDDLAPTLAILAGVDEAVIDALEVEDTNKLLAALGRIRINPLSAPATSPE